MTEPAESAEPAEPAPKKPPLSTRLKELLAEYGSIALVIYLVLFGLVLGGFIIAILAGVDSGDSAGGIAGTIGAAWVATKLTQPFRIAGTLALTPLVGALIHRWRGSSDDATDSEDPGVPGDTGDPDDEEE